MQVDSDSSVLTCLARIAFFLSPILAQTRNVQRDCDQLSAAAAAAGTPGCGTFTAQTRVRNVARAIKNVVIPPSPPLRPPPPLQQGPV